MIDNLSKLEKKHTDNTIKEVELKSGQRGGTKGDLMVYVELHRQGYGLTRAKLHPTTTGQ